MGSMDKSSASRYYSQLKSTNEKNVNLNLDFYIKLALVSTIIHEEDTDIISLIQKSDQKELLPILKNAISEFPAEIREQFKLYQIENIDEIDTLNLLGFPVSILKFRICRINVDINRSILA